MSEWDNRCLESIRKEKKEAEVRYSVTFGQTEIYCSRCGRSSVPGNHECRDLRFERLSKTRLLKSGESKTEKPSHLCEKLRALGRTKAATKLMISRKTVSDWIDRGNVPSRYRERVSTL
jgi:hypothetical protein